jgi:hypothetical protein
MLGVERNRGGWGRYFVQVYARPYKEARDFLCIKREREREKRFVIVKSSVRDKEMQKE